MLEKCLLRERREDGKEGGKSLLIAKQVWATRLSGGTAGPCSGSGLVGGEPGYQAGAAVPSGGAVPTTDSYEGQALMTGHGRPACWYPLSGKEYTTSAWPMQGANNFQGAIGTTVFRKKRCFVGEKGMASHSSILA